MKVQSSRLSEHTYDPATQTLTITFNNGHVGSYAGFPAVGTEEVPGYDDFCRSTSPGSFFHKHIERNPLYPYTDATPRSEDDTLEL